MPSSFTQNLGIEKPATGEQAGAWGNTANTSYDTLDAGIDGSLTIPMAASTYTLATNNGGAPAQGVNKLIVWTGAQTQAGTVQIIPNTAQKIYYMQNKTTGGMALVFQQGAGSTYTLNAGYAAMIYSDGKGASAGVLPALDNPQFSTVLVTGSLSFNAPQTFTQPITFNGSVQLNGSTVATGLQINTTGYTAAPGDVYYRSSAGPAVPLQIGSAGQVLSVAPGPALAWTTPPVATAIGLSIPGSMAYSIYFADPSELLAQDSAILISSGVGIGIGLLPTHSLHLGYARRPEIWLDTSNPAAAYRQLVFATNNQQRWELSVPLSTESGGDQGSDLQIASWNDASNSMRQVIFCSRSTGNVTIAGNLTVGDIQGGNIYAMLRFQGGSGGTGIPQFYCPVDGVPPISSISNSNLMIVQTDFTVLTFYVRDVYGVLRKASLTVS